MNTELLLNNIGKDIFSRNDLYNAAVKELTSFKETDMRNMLEKLLKDRIIIRIAHNQYVRNNNTIAVNEYMPFYSDESKEIITEMIQSDFYGHFSTLHLQH